ncbi:hypothetical protein [Chryseobacterium indologenes]|uniref:hypothetical protein n=1 Tax=Chryseobacterium indologenes TaxID=253 RepID=UPI001624455F|nr:hypothetical protein [Chryseobacterium indologenes]
MEWKISRIEYNWFSSGKSSRTFVQITYWYNPVKHLKKETQITYTASGSEELPDWILAIQENI